MTLGFIIFQCPLTTVHHLYINVARIAELLRSPAQRRSRVTELCQETADEKGMFQDFDGRRAETGMIGYQLAMSCRRAMLSPAKKPYADALLLLLLLRTFI